MTGDTDIGPPNHVRTVADLSVEAARRLADLHHEYLPESLLSRLGPDYLTRFYQMCAHSEAERVIVGERDERPLAVCLLSLDPGGLTRRMRARTPLIPAMVRSWYRLPMLALLLGARVEAALPDAPEVVLLVTTPAARGQGLAQDLLRVAKDHVRQAGAEIYFVKTEDAPENPALGFYRRHGFREVGTRRVHGARFRILVADAAAPTEP